MRRRVAAMSNWGCLHVAFEEQEYVGDHKSGRSLFMRIQKHGPGATTAPFRLWEITPDILLMSMMNVN